MLIFMIPINTLVFTQNLSKSISLSYNLIQGQINEHSIYLDIIPSDQLSIGFSIGKIFFNSMYDPLPLSPSQNTYPGTVYEGFVVRLNASYYLYRNEFKRYWTGGYLGLQLIYKDVFYNNISFKDGDKKDHYIYYDRNEKAKVFGIDIIEGICFSFGPKKIRESVFLNPYGGIGYRFRHRDIETLHLTNRGYSPSDGPIPVLGNEIKKQNYLTLVLGAKVGINIKINNPYTGKKYLF